jgi:Flp pilus assembly protein TadG
MGALKRLSSERGAELVEFALTFPLLLLVVLGIIDMGLILQRYEVITNAAREGARVSVLPGYGDPEIVARVNQYLQGTGLEPDTIDPVVPVRSQISAGGYCINVVAVTVSYDHPFFFLAGIGNFFGSSFGTKKVSSTSTMRSEMQAAATGAGGNCPGSE